MNRYHYDLIGVTEDGYEEVVARSIPEEQVVVTEAAMKICVEQKKLKTIIDQKVVVGLRRRRGDWKGAKRIN